MTHSGGAGAGGSGLQDGAGRVLLRGAVRGHGAAAARGQDPVVGHVQRQRLRPHGAKETHQMSMHQMRMHQMRMHQMRMHQMRMHQMRMHQMHARPRQMRPCASRCQTRSTPPPQPPPPQSRWRPSSVTMPLSPERGREDTRRGRDS